MLTPGFLLQALPIIAIVLAVFIFIVLKMLSRLKHRDEGGHGDFRFNKAQSNDQTAPGLERLLGSYPARVRSAQGNFEADAKEISLVGAFIICDRPLAIAEPLELSLELAETVQLQAIVTWNNCNVPEDEIVVRGMRVRFLSVSSEARAAIFDQLNVQDSHSAKARPKAVPP